LHGLNQARFAGQTRQSYPSKHTVDAGAALAILAPLEPHRVPEFDWMADEIAFSRLYGACHYLSDLTGGAFLGTLIGDYERRKAGLAS
jgi:membrane-associated phospholipid phosphatase